MNQSQGSGRERDRRAAEAGPRDNRRHGGWYGRRSWSRERRLAKTDRRRSRSRSNDRRHWRAHHPEYRGSPLDNDRRTHRRNWSPPHESTTPRQQRGGRPDTRSIERSARDVRVGHDGNSHHRRGQEEGFAERGERGGRHHGRRHDHSRFSSNERSSRQRSRRRRKQKRRRRRSHSSSYSSSSSASSSASRRSSRVAVLPHNRAGVVSDDDDEDNKRTAGNPQKLSSNNKSSPRSKRDNDDQEGHYCGRPGSVIADKYRVERELGVGTFGRVVECLDLSRQQRHNDNLVAIKVVRSVKRYCESALIEADIVSDVNRRGGARGRGNSHFAVMYDAFNFRGHYCLVFESLGPSLYDYLKRNNYQPFPMRYVHDFSKQLLEAIEYLHSFRLIHTDLKPENILVTKCREVSQGNLRLPESTRIKVIDFGGATYDNEKKSTVVNTRQYRAPEVILNCGWSMPSDLWSAGAILAELYQGELLFATHNNCEHLALIERIVGPFSQTLLQRSRSSDSSLANQVFDSSGRHRMQQVLPRDSLSYVMKMLPLEGIVRNRKDGWFLNLLRSILVIDPQRRATAREALRSGFGNTRH